jgi:hypothetical protein
MYMVEGIRRICKYHFRSRRLGQKQAASLRKRIAEYALEALASHGNERFQDSAFRLARDPVYKAAKRYYHKSMKAYDKVSNLGDSAL